jgi:plasmid replication initiation protein
MKDYPVPVAQQHNVITAARYEYTLWEKRILYKIIQKMVDDIKKGANETDLFANRVLRLPIKNLLADDYRKNLYNLKRAAKSIMGKIFEVTINEGEENEIWEAGVFIYHSKIQEGILQVTISEMLMPYLIDLTKNFTRYSPYTAMILKSTYSQRFYEFCCRFRDTGHWHVSVEDLRFMLMLETKYATYGELKKNVLDVAQKELQELYDSNESDVCFVYDELKTKRAITDLHIRIKAKEKNKGVEESSADELQMIHQYLKAFWPQDNQEARRTQVFNELNKKKAFKEFKIKADDICARYQDKRAHDLAGILTIAMKEDLGIVV